MKKYEEACRSYLDNKVPLVIRIDGHCFSKFTKGLTKPYEEWFHKAMTFTTGKLLAEF
jgi:tRNA(His) guanylyltransferase